MATPAIPLNQYAAFSIFAMLPPFPFSPWHLPQPDFIQGFSLAHNTPKGFYDELRDDPTRGRRWANAMSLYATIVPIDALVRTFDWPALAALGPIVDVGGGHGAVSVGLAKRLLSASSSSLVPPSGPSVKFIVQDLPHVVAEGPAHIEPELRDHVSFMPYDIRTPQPVIGAPVYFFRAIFHNWPDASCVEILRNQIPALTRPGVKIIIHDAITKDEEEPGTLPLYLEKRRRFVTLQFPLSTYPFLLLLCLPTLSLSLPPFSRFFSCFTPLPSSFIRSITPTSQLSLPLSHTFFIPLSNIPSLL